MMPSGDHGNQTGPKRTPDQREAQMAEMVKMIARGYQKKDIAKKFRLDPSTITRDWKIAIGQLRKDQEGDLDEWRATVIAGLKEMMRECWEAWEKSKQDAESETIEEKDATPCRSCRGEGTKTTKKGEVVECPKCGGEGCLPGERKVTKTKAGRLPVAQYLQVIERCKAAIRALKGLDAETELKLRVEAEVKHEGKLRVEVDWSALYESAKGLALKKVDDVERLIEEASQLPSGLKEISLPSVNGNGQQGHDERSHDGELNQGQE